MTSSTRRSTAAATASSGATTTACSDLPAREPSHRVGCDVAGDAWVLLQPPYRVLVPVLAERNVDAQPVSVAHELVAAGRADAEQHLKLVLGRREAERTDLGERVLDQLLVM